MWFYMAEYGWYGIIDLPFGNHTWLAGLKNEGLEE